MKRRQRGVSPVVATILLVAITITLTATFAAIIESTYGNVHPPGIIVFNLQFVSQKTVNNWCQNGNTEAFDQYDLSPSQPIAANNLNFRVQALTGNIFGSSTGANCPNLDTGWGVMLIDNTGANVIGIWVQGGFYSGSNSVNSQESTPGGSWNINGNANVNFLSQMIVFYSQTNVPTVQSSEMTIYSTSNDIITGSVTVY